MEALSYRTVEHAVGAVHGMDFVMAGGPPKNGSHSAPSVIERYGKYGRAYKKFRASASEAGSTLHTASAFHSLTVADTVGAILPQAHFAYTAPGPGR